MDSFTAVFLPCSAPLVLVSLLAPCPFFPCAPTSLSGLTSPVDHLVSIPHNGLEVFSCILVFDSGHLAFQLLPGVCLLFSPARSSQHFEHLLWVHLPRYLIYLLAVHIHHHVRRLQPKSYQQGRTNTHSCLTHSHLHWEAHHWPQHR